MNLVRLIKYSDVFNVFRYNQHPLWKLTKISILHSHLESCDLTWSLSRTRPFAPSQRGANSEFFARYLRLCVSAVPSKTPQPAYCPSFYSVRREKSIKGKKRLAFSHPNICPDLTARNCKEKARNWRRQGKNPLTKAEVVRRKNVGKNVTKDRWSFVLTQRSFW